MRKILLTVTLIMMLCGVSSADIVYMTSTGNLGTIRINSSSDIEEPLILYTETASSPLLTSYWNGSSTSLAIISRNATASGDRAYVFNSDMTKYGNSADIVGVYGTENADYTESGYSLFLTAGSMIYEVDTRKFGVLNSFDCASVISSDGVSTKVNDIAVGKQSIHVIASAGERQKYIRFDGQLKSGVNYFLSRDISAGASVVEVNGDVPLIGHNFGIEALNDNSNRLYRLLSSDNPVKAICSDGDKGYFYATQYQSGNKYVNTIMHLANNSFFTPFTIEAASGGIKMLRDSKNSETLAVMTDGGITFFAYKNGRTSRHDLTSETLGGTPAYITASTVSGYNGNSSSSGCNASGLGIIILGLAMLIRRKAE